MWAEDCEGFDPSTGELKCNNPSHPFKGGCWRAQRHDIERYERILEQQKQQDQLISLDEEEVEESMVDVCVTEDAEVAKSLTKSAAEIFMEEKIEQMRAKKKLRAKLELLEKEVKLRHQLLQQAKTLLRSKEAMLKSKVRISYSKCHKFWRGKVVLAHKSLVDEQVNAAKERLGLTRRFDKFNIDSKFNIDAMVAKIDELAPGAKYKSARPAPAPSRSSTRRPFHKKEQPSVRYFTIPIPPLRLQQRQRYSERSPPQRLTTPHRKSEDLVEAPSGIRGDVGIVSYGDTIAEDLCYDLLTQLKHGDDEYFWDDFCYSTLYEEETEVADASCSFIYEDCNFAEADEVSYYSEGEDGDFFAETNAEIDFAEDNCAGFDFAEDDDEIDFAEDDDAEEEFADNSGGDY